MNLHRLPLLAFLLLLVLLPAAARQDTWDSPESLLHATHEFPDHHVRVGEQFIITGTLVGDTVQADRVEWAAISVLGCTVISDTIYDSEPRIVAFETVLEASASLCTWTRHGIAVSEPPLGPDVIISDLTISGSTTDRDLTLATEPWDTYVPVVLWLGAIYYLLRRGLILASLGATMAGLGIFINSAWPISETWGWIFLILAFWVEAFAMPHVYHFVQRRYPKEGQV